MDKVYHETDKKDNSWKDGTPCVAVRAFRPNFKDYDLPSLIQLSAGRVNHNGEPAFHSHKWLVYENPTEPQLIRKAIEEFDAFKVKVYAEGGGD